MIQIHSAEIVPGIPRTQELRVAFVAEDDPVVAGTLGVSPDIEEMPVPWEVGEVGDETARLRYAGLGTVEVPLSRGAARELEPGGLLVAQPQVLLMLRKVEHVGMATIERIIDNEEEVDVDLPLLRVHCPRREGCSADYTLATESGHEGAFELTIVGLGGGAGAKITGSESETWSVKGAADGRCREATIPGRMVIGDGVLKINGQPIREGTMGDLVWVDRDGREERAIAQDADDCLLAYEEAKHRPRHWWVERLPDGEPLEKEVELARETSGSFSMGWAKKDVIDLKLEYTRTTSTTTTIKTTLSPGAKYAMYAPDTDDGMERCWTTA